MHFYPFCTGSVASSTHPFWRALLVNTKTYFCDLFGYPFTFSFLSTLCIPILGFSAGIVCPFQLLCGQDASYLCSIFVDMLSYEFYGIPLVESCSFFETIFEEVMAWRGAYCDTFRAFLDFFACDFSACHFCLLLPVLISTYFPGFSLWIYGHRHLVLLHFPLL